MSKSKRVVTAALSPGEALHMTRRRAGRTQEDEAARCDVPVLTYHKWESDVEARGRDGEVRPCPEVPLRWAQLSRIERAYLLRRRSGKSRAAIASEMGVSENWLSAMESGRQPAARLLRYWDLA